MSKIEDAINWAIAIANDSSHGYDQTNRWGPDYDCSSLVISAWQYGAGVPVKDNGASYTGDMRKAFLNSGFSDVTSSVNVSNGSGLQRGDVLLNQVHHTAIYLGNNQLVHASLNEKGGVTGGQTGDQANEICVRSYYNRPWDVILRYTGEDGGSSSGGSEEIDWEALKKLVIATGQAKANEFVGHDQIATDGIKGPQSIKMKIRVLQHAMNKDYNAGLVEDGIFGNNTRTALGNHYISYGETQWMVTAMEIIASINGCNPNGIEFPGTYGNGLANAYNGNTRLDNGTIEWCTCV